MGLPKDTTILVVGAGTFGISTAYHLCKRGYSSVHCIDAHPVPSPDAAGNDLNKIIRPEYEEFMYAKMALEAQVAWRKEEWNGIYHESGRLATSCEAPGIASLQHAYRQLQSLGQADGISAVETPDEIVRHCPQLHAASGIDSWKGLYSPRAGWAQSRKALEKLAADAVAMGAKFTFGIDGTATALAMDGNDPSLISGVRVASGKLHTADRCVFSLGAASAEVVPDVLAGTIRATAWAVAHIRVPEKLREEFRNMPVIDNLEMGFAFEPDENGLLKIGDGSPGYVYGTGIYTDARSGESTTYSLPRYTSSRPMHGVPKESLDGIRHFLEAALPQVANEPLVDAKLCWDADTSDGHFLIDWHPRSQGKVLFATGGSGHAFKMFPILGDYVVDALEGKERGLRRQWQLHGRGKFTDDILVHGDRPAGGVKDLRDIEMVVIQ